MQYFKSTKKYVEDKMVFCGIDIHKQYWSLCYSCDGEAVEKLSIHGNFKSLIRHRDIFFLFFKEQ